MRDQHIAPAQLEKFLRAELDREGTRLVVDHLLSGCSECRALAHGLTDERGLQLVDDLYSPQPSALGWDYETSFRAVADRLPGQAELLSAERLRGLSLWLELGALPAGERPARVESEPRFAHWGLYDRLMAESQRLVRREPRQALAAAELAVAVAGRLSPAVPDGRLAQDFLSAAHQARANARRVLSDFAGAATDLQLAWSAFSSGTADPAEEAGLRRLEGYLLLDLGSFERAIDRFGAALKIYREIGDRPAQAKVYVQQAEAMGYVDPRAAVSRLTRALPWLGRSEEPRVLLAARHNLLWFLNDAGRAAEASPALSNCRSLYERFADDPGVVLRRVWLEGRIERNLDGPVSAETRLRRAWDGFAELGLGHELVLVAVDLIESLTAQGKSQSSLDLASAVMPMLSAYGLHAEGLEVWLLLTRNLQRRELERDAFAKLSAYFRRNFKHPQRKLP